MKTAAELAQQTPLGETHRVHNVATDLSHYNLYSADTALVEAVEREGGAWGHAELTAFGQHIGQPDYLELGQLANQYKPELDTHDRFGNRVDLVRYHPAYHELMSTALGNGLAADPWLNPRAGAHVVRGAKALEGAFLAAGGQTLGHAGKQDEPVIIGKAAPEPPQQQSPHAQLVNTPVTVAHEQPGRGQHGHGAGHHEARADPLRTALAQFKVVAHVRDGHVHDGRRHDRGHGAQHDRQKQQPAMPLAIAGLEGLQAVGVVVLGCAHGVAITPRCAQLAHRPDRCRPCL